MGSNHPPRGATRRHAFHLSANGDVLSSFRLPVDRKSFQPEGITLGTDDRIFVVGKPNILAVYRKLMR